MRLPSRPANGLARLHCPPCGVQSGSVGNAEASPAVREGATCLQGWPVFQPGRDLAYTIPDRESALASSPIARVTAGVGAWCRWQPARTMLGPFGLLRRREYPVAAGYVGVTLADLGRPGVSPDASPISAPTQRNNHILGKLPEITQYNVFDETLRRQMGCTISCTQTLANELY